MCSSDLRGPNNNKPGPGGAGAGGTSGGTPGDTAGGSKTLQRMSQQRQNTGMKQPVSRHGTQKGTKRHDDINATLQNPTGQATMGSPVAAQDLMNAATGFGIMNQGYFTAGNQSDLGQTFSFQGTTPLQDQIGQKKGTPGFESKSMRLGNFQNMGYLQTPGQADQRQIASSEPNSQSLNFQQLKRGYEEVSGSYHDQSPGDQPLAKRGRRTDDDQAVDDQQAPVTHNPDDADFQKLKLVGQAIQHMTDELNGLIAQTKTAATAEQ